MDSAFSLASRVICPNQRRRRLRTRPVRSCSSENVRWRKSGAKLTSCGRTWTSSTHLFPSVTTTCCARTYFSMTKKVCAYVVSNMNIPPPPPFEYSHCIYINAPHFRVVQYAIGPKRIPDCFHHRFIYTSLCNALPSSLLSNPPPPYKNHPPPPSPRRSVLYRLRVRQLQLQRLRHWQPLLRICR